MTLSAVVPAHVSYLAELVDAILVDHPFYQQSMAHALEFITDAEKERLNGLIRFLVGKGMTVPEIAECYNTVSSDMQEEQIFFFKNGRYRCSTYAEVADRVYHNPAYMHKYMYGLIITNFLWPNHVRMYRYFAEHLPRDRAGQYLEVGPGHGFSMATAASKGSFNRLIGIDISQASVDQTRELLQHFAPDAVERCEVRLGDFFDATELQIGSFDALVMGEVLEHVERPDIFLRRLHELARDDAFVYVTTCVNAPAIDHIFLWRTTDEIEQLIEGCGFAIEHALRLPYEGRTLEQARKQNLPIRVAYVLRKEAA